MAEKLEQIGTLEASLAETTEQAQASGAELAVQQAAVAKLEAQLTESRTETKGLVAKRDEIKLTCLQRSTKNRRCVTTTLKSKHALRSTKWHFVCSVPYRS